MKYKLILGSLFMLSIGFVGIQLCSCAIDTSAPDVVYEDAGREAGIKFEPRDNTGTPVCYPVLNFEAGVTSWLCPIPAPCGVECVEEKPGLEMYPDPGVR